MSQHTYEQGVDVLVGTQVQELARGWVCVLVWLWYVLCLVDRLGLRLFSGLPGGWETLVTAACKDRPRTLRQQRS
jgi:hypothetical protein